MLCNYFSYLFKRIVAHRSILSRRIISPQR